VTRLASERKITLQQLEQSEAGGPALVRLRLLVEPSALHPYEWAALEPVFAGAREVATDELQRRHAGERFDPDALVAKAYDTHVPAPPSEGRPLASAVAWALGAAGIFFGVRDLVTRSREPFALLAALIAGSFAHRLTPTRWWWGRRTPAWSLLLLLPLGVLVLSAAAIQLWPDRPLGPDSALCSTLILLGAYQGLLASLPAARSEVARRRDDLARARRWAVAELRKPHPQLRDAWVPHLEALGLGAALERWRSQRSSNPLIGRDRAGLDADVRFEAPFTARAPARPSRADDWEAGFYVPPGARTRHPREEDDESDEEESEKNDADLMR
jgi:hypothetical protein